MSVAVTQGRSDTEANPSRYRIDAANENGPFGERTELAAGAISAMNSHGVAVGISEGEGNTERSIERCDQDRDSGENHCVVQDHLRPLYQVAHPVRRDLAHAHLTISLPDTISGYLIQGS